MGWTMSLVPMPRDWERALPILAPIGARSCEGHHVTENQLFDAGIQAYDIARRDVEPLVEWMSV